MDLEEWKVFAKYHSALMGMFMVLWKLNLIKDVATDRSQILINTELYDSKDYIKKYSARMTEVDIKIATDMMDTLMNLGFFRGLPRLDPKRLHKRPPRPIHIYRAIMNWKSDTETLK